MTLPMHQLAYFGPEGQKFFKLVSYAVTDNLTNASKLIHMAAVHFWPVERSMRGVSKICIVRVSLNSEIPSIMELVKSLES